METLKDHTHNGTDSPKLRFNEAIENGQQTAVSTVAGTADGTYSGNEQTMINDLKTAVNDLILKLQNVGILQ